MHAVVQVPHNACVIRMRPIERIIQRFQSMWILELFYNSSYVTQHLIEAFTSRESMGEVKLSFESRKTPRSLTVQPVT
jgi:hypothetical protein